MTDHTTDRLVSPMSGDDDVQENSLRPHRLDDYIGQEKVKGNLQILLDAAKLRGEALDHVLLYGPPGLGKTSLSLIISAEMGVSIRMTSGPAIEHAGDLASILTALEERDVLFIDEIHRLSRVVEERLYSAMEDFALDRSEEHTSELQSRRDLVCRLLLEKKNDTRNGAGGRCGGG